MTYVISKTILETIQNINMYSDERWCHFSGLSRESKDNILAAAFGERMKILLNGSPNSKSPSKLEAGTVELGEKTTRLNIGERKSENIILELTVKNNLFNIRIKEVKASTEEKEEWYRQELTKFLERFGNFFSNLYSKPQIANDFFTVLHNADLSEVSGNEAEYMTKIYIRALTMYRTFGMFPKSKQIEILQKGYVIARKAQTKSKCIYTFAKVFFEILVENDAVDILEYNGNVYLKLDEHWKYYSVQSKKNTIKSRYLAYVRYSVNKRNAECFSSWYLWKILCGNDQYEINDEE